MNNKIPAVDKTVQLLTRLSEHESTQAELSRTLGISMSTAYRILTTLLEHRWVRKKEGSVYELGDGLLGLTRGMSGDSAVIEKAREKVRRIAERHRIACKLSVRQGNLQLTYFRAEPRGPVALTGDAGSTFPLIEGSVGAALLSGESDTEIAALIRTCELDLPEKRQPELLFRAVREVRERGTVLNLRKNRWNIAAFSVPLHNADGRVIAALTLIGSAGDFAGKKRAKWERLLKQAASECETETELDKHDRRHP
ncbi:MAG: IclR family transcriptional regulator [Lentisphaeria bacterium]|nr:IclR family transcriptional regulator [Lentisphaeria bacterium]